MRMNCLRSRERAQLVGRAHRRHIEVKRQQAAILIALVLHGFRRNLRSRQALVDLDIFAAGRGGAATGDALAVSVLVLAEADRLRNAVLGEGKVLGGESRNELSLLVFHHDGFDHQLRLDSERYRFPSAGGLFWPICCAVAERTAKVRRRAMNDRSLSHLRTSGAAEFPGCASGWC